MKHKVLFLLAGILTILVVECNRTTPVSPNQTITLTPGPGAFGLGYMKGLSKSTANAAVKSGANVSFDLGSIKGSAAFYFLLYNIGSTPITNVTLSIADSQFEVYPSAMDTLIPGNDVGMLPVVKVSAIHGTALDGYGFRPLMPKGINSGKLLVTGRTKTSAGKDTVVALTADLAVNALVMDILVKCGRDTINMAEPCGGTIGNNTFDGYQVVNMRAFGYNYYGDSISIINTGNVPIILRIQYLSGYDGTIKDTLHYVIDSTQKITVSKGENIPNYGTYPIFCLDGHNTIADHIRLPLEPNGKCYFEWFNFDTTTIVPNSDSLNLQPFISRADSSSSFCADIANFLYLIDSTVVFWDRQGACSDNSYAYTLYSVHSIDSVLCRRYDSVAGPQEECTDQQYHDMLDTIIANLSSMDLGIGGAHQVNPIPLK
jgi:hypothetical protein